MKRIAKILSYQLFSLTIGEVAVIAAAVAIMDGFWPHHPWWAPYLIGFAIAGAEIALQPIWRKRMAP